MPIDVCSMDTLLDGKRNHTPLVTLALMCSMDTLLDGKRNHTPLVTLALKHTRRHYDGDKSAPDCFPSPPHDQAGTHRCPFTSKATPGWSVSP